MTTLQSRPFDSQIKPLSTAPAHKRKLDQAGDSLTSAPTPSQLHEADLGLDDEKIAESALREGVDIPEAKRRAQNRAAQRAFRERKEKHLKDLEARLAELENESRSWKSTNMALRNKLSLLENELQQYRWTDVPGTSLGAASVTPSAASGGAQETSPNGAVINQYQAVPSPGSVPGLSSDSTTSSSTPNRADEFCTKLSTACVVNQKKIAKDAPYISADYPGWQNDELFGRNSSIEYWLQNGAKPPQQQPDLQTLPVQHPAHTPVQHPQQLPGQPQQQQQQMPLPQQDKSDPFSFVFSEPQNGQDPLNLDFGTMATGFGGFGLDDKDGMPDLMGLLNNDLGVFDPLDGLMEWNPPKDNMTQEVTDPHMAGSNMSGNAVNSGNTASTTTPTTTATATATATGTPTPATTGGGGSAGTSSTPGMNSLPPHEQSLLPSNTQYDSPLFSPASNESIIKSPLLGAYEGDTRQKSGQPDEQVPTASQKFIQCADVWDRICSHPRFGDIDINSMCQELRNKARCSKTGVVLDEQDVNAVLKSMR